MALFYWYTMMLFWSPATGAVAKTHLRVLMAIKSLYFTFSALQLRNGYPPPASYRYCLMGLHPECAACSAVSASSAPVGAMHVAQWDSKSCVASYLSDLGMEMRYTSFSSCRGSDARVAQHELRGEV